MANLVITSTATHIKVLFNDYSTGVGWIESYFKRTSLIRVSLETNGNIIQVEMDSPYRNRWKVSYQAETGCLIIDSIDGVAPTSTADLLSKLKDLLI